MSTSTYDAKLVGLREAVLDAYEAIEQTQPTRIPALAHEFATDLIRRWDQNELEHWHFALTNSDPAGGEPAGPIQGR